MAANDALLRFLLLEIGGRSHFDKLQETCETILRETDRKTTIDPLLVLALINVESGYKPGAVSGMGARGLMQLMPATAEALAANEGLPYYSPDDLFDPVLNVTLGTRYLIQLYEDFKHVWPWALTAYNRGPGNTRKILAAHQGSIPSSILELYAGLVLRRYYRFVQNFPTA